MNFGAAFNKGLTLKMGQTHVHKYLGTLLNHVQNGDIKPEAIISHTLDLEEGPYGYDLFKHKRDGCTKVVLRP